MPAGPGTKCKFAFHTLGEAPRRHEAMCRTDRCSEAKAPHAVTSQLPPPNDRNTRTPSVFSKPLAYLHGATAGLQRWQPDRTTSQGKTRNVVWSTPTQARGQVRALFTNAGLFLPTLQTEGQFTAPSHRFGSIFKDRKSSRSLRANQET